MEQTRREFLIDIEELVEHVFADLDELCTTKLATGRDAS